jgi:hypothetical protein
MDFDLSTLLPSFLLGSIGIAATKIGKATGNMKNVGLGITLIACSYFLTEAWQLWTAGIILTTALFFKNH